VSIETKHSRLSPEYVLLGFLCHQPGHGYDLHKRLADEFGYIWHVSQSQTYSILKRLEAQEYIEATIVQQAKLPARQLFSLTEIGLDHFNTWLEAPTPCSVHAIRVEFITRLYFIQQYQPDLIQEIIRRQTDEVLKGIQQLEKTQSRVPGDQTFNHLALDLRIKLLSSMITWLDECRIKLASNLFS